MLLSLWEFAKMSWEALMNYYILGLAIAGLLSVVILAYLIKLRRKRNAISLISSTPGSIPAKPQQQYVPSVQPVNMQAPQYINNPPRYQAGYNVVPGPRYIMMRRYRWINRVRRLWRRAFRRGRRGRRWMNRYY